MTDGADGGRPSYCPLLRNIDDRCSNCPRYLCLPCNLIILEISTAMLLAARQRVPSASPDRKAQQSLTYRKTHTPTQALFALALPKSACLQL